MKKVLSLIILLLISLSLGLLIACDEEEPNSSDKDITGVKFEDLTVTYDGTEKSIIATDIPEGIEATYEGNKGTDAGTYNAKVTLSGEGYKTKTISAKLVIKKAEIFGVSVAQNEKITVDNQMHKPELSGTLPSGVSVKWYFNDVQADNGVKSAGKYNVKVVISGKNYEDLVLNTTFKISHDLTGLATDFVSSFGSVPNAWDILPDSFSVDNYAIQQSQIPSYTGFTNVSSIPTKYIGKQLNVVLGVLNKCDIALDYVNIVYGSLNVIGNAYQTFLNDSPDNYEEFNGSTGVFTYKILLDGNKYYLTASINSTVKVTLFSDADTATYGARVQLTETTVLKYTVSGTGIKIALNVLNASSTQVEFVRNPQNNNLVTGYIYEYLTVAGKEVIATSALLDVGETYTTVVGTKGDFIPTSDSRNCEVYRNSTGSLVGTEVRETLDKSGKSYDTLWYSLKDITGITSIKKEDNANGVNPDTIYINGKSDTIHSMFVNGILDTSRRFDIEFKKVMAYVYNSEIEEYEEIEFEVPMMFVQEKCLGTFEKDYKSKNDVTISLNVSDSDKNAVDVGYKIFVITYDTIKNLVSQQSIIDYCAEEFVI